MYDEKSPDSIKGIKRRVHGVDLKEENRSDVKKAEMMDMKGIFGMEKLKEKDIDAILATGDIFACFERVKPKKKKIRVPNIQLPYEMTYEDLMDYLEYVIESH